jgi:hypothetical protein
MACRWVGTASALSSVMSRLDRAAMGRGMAEALVVKWPVLGRHERAAEWLRIWTDMGRAPRTIDAYARGLAEYLQVCEREGIDPLTATRAHVAVFLSESRRNRAAPLSLWTWAKVVRRLALAAGLPQFSTHTTRHLCLTDLARMGWELHAIATFAGLHTGLHPPVRPRSGRQAQPGYGADPRLAGPHVGPARGTAVGGGDPVTTPTRRPSRDRPLLPAGPGRFTPPNSTVLRHCRSASGRRLRPSAGMCAVGSSAGRILGSRSGQRFIA